MNAGWRWQRALDAETLESISALESISGLNSPGVLPAVRTISFRVARCPSPCACHSAFLAALHLPRRLDKMPLPQQLCGLGWPVQAHVSPRALLAFNRDMLTSFRTRTKVSPQKHSLTARGRLGPQRSGAASSAYRMSWQGSHPTHYVLQHSAAAMLAHPCLATDEQCESRRSSESSRACFGLTTSTMGCSIFNRAELCD